MIFSRHAKRRMRLYSFSENDIKTVLESSSLEMSIRKQEIIAKLKKFPYPIKVVFEVKEKSIFIITCYLLKRAKYEN